MRVIECSQGSAQWMASRVGRVTASRVSECLSKYATEKRKADETAERRSYRVDLIVERLTGRSTENFVSPEMVWGRENEDAARIAYEESTDEFTEKIGFILHPDFDWSGASPDALVGDVGGLEIKCPKSANHWKWRAEGVVPEEHEPQLVWNMACSGREWWDFASFDPRLPKKVCLFVKRLQRNEERIAQVVAEVLRMHNDVEADIAREGLPPTVWSVDNPLVEMPDELNLPAPPLEGWAAAFEQITQEFVP